MNDKQIENAKTFAKLVINHSVGATCAMALSSIAHPASKRKKLEVMIGAYVIGAMIGDKSDDWVDNKIDEIVNIAKKVQAFFNGEPVTTEEPQETTLDNE